MITIERAAEEWKRQGVRKAALTKKAAAELCQKIDLVLRDERPRLSSSAAEFLHSIRRIAAAPAVRLSKKQRDTTEAILLKAFSEAPPVILEGDSVAALRRFIYYAMGDSRISAFEENLLAHLKHRLNEPIVAISEKQWRIVEEINRKTHFGLDSQPTPVDPDGLIENDDPDGLPPEDIEAATDPTARWSLVGVDEDAD